MKIYRKAEDQNDGQMTQREVYFSNIPIFHHSIIPKLSFYRFKTYLNSAKSGQAELGLICRVVVVAFLAMALNVLHPYKTWPSETYITPGEYVDIANLTAMGFIVNKNFGVFIDVSKPEEWKQGHVAEATHIPLEKLKNRMKEIEKQKNEVVMVISKFGDRSSEASKMLAKNGFMKVYNILGGMVDWKIMGYPVEK